MKRTVLLALGLILFIAWSQPVPAADEREPKHITWFRDAKFGLFVHWGVYSLLSKGEWVMHRDKMTIADYEKLYPQFNPTEYDADEWVAMVKDAGMKYITITSKHHDGFCMYDTRLSDYKITNTPFSRDVIAELAEACRKKDIKLFFYYSQLDWHHPDYYPRGETGQHSGRPESGDWSRYLQYYTGQVRELCTDYGEIGGLWFDGWWDRPGVNWNLDELYNMIHTLQPEAMIGSNHHRQPFHGEDFQMFEQDLPGENTAGFNKAAIAELPLETCLTMNGSWGYNRNDTNYKTVKELVHYLVKAAGYGANLLLNVGPMPTGEIQPEFKERLHAVGQWLRRNGESVYRTRRGPFVNYPWGTSVRKGKNTVYLHVLNIPGGKLQLPPADFKVKSAKVLHGKKVEVTSSGGAGTELSLAFVDQDAIDTIIVLKTEPLE